MDKYFISLTPDVDETLNGRMVTSYGAENIKWATKISCENSLMSKLRAAIMTKVFKERSK